MALTYLCIHSIVNLFQFVTLTVALNSKSSNASLAILLSNQFVELKTSVFKRTAINNLFQISCSDIRERFHLVLLLALVRLFGLLCRMYLVRDLVREGGDRDRRLCLLCWYDCFADLASLTSADWVTSAAPLPEVRLISLCGHALPPPPPPPSLPYTHSHKPHHDNDVLLLKKGLCPKYGGAQVGPVLLL